MAISRTSGLGAALVGMLAVALVSSSLAAQDVGDRVRVLSGGTTTIGEVTALSSDGFELLGHGRRHAFTYGQIYRLEQSLGARSLWKKGLVYGAGGGFGAGVLLGFLNGIACDALTFGILGGECAAIGLEVAIVAGVTWGGVGGVLGMAVGALITRESWTAIPIRGRQLKFRPMVGPVGRGGHGGVVLGGRIGF